MLTLWRSYSKELTFFSCLVHLRFALGKVVLRIIETDKEFSVVISERTMSRNLIDTQQ